MAELQSITTIDQQVPLSKVRAHYTDITQKAKEKGYVLVLKNYVLHSIIMDPVFFLTHLTDARDNIRDKEKRTQAVNALLQFRAKIAVKTAKWDPLKQLLKDRVSR